MKFPQLKVGQVGYFNGMKITRISYTHYSVNGVKYTKGELIGSVLVLKYKMYAH